MPVAAVTASTSAISEAARLKSPAPGDALPWPSARSAGRALRPHGRAATRPHNASQPSTSQSAAAGWPGHRPEGGRVRIVVAKRAHRSSAAARPRRIHPRPAARGLPAGGPPGGPAGAAGASARPARPPRASTSPASLRHGGAPKAPRDRSRARGRRRAARAAQPPEAAAQRALARSDNAIAPRRHRRVPTGARPGARPRPRPELERGVERPGARLACAAASARSARRPGPASAGRALQERGGGGDPAASLRAAGRQLELGGNVLVGCERRMRPMPGPAIRIALGIGGLCQRPMHARRSLGGRGGVDRRPEQWVAERNPRTDSDEVGGFGGSAASIGRPSTAAACQRSIGSPVGSAAPRSSSRCVSSGSWSTRRRKLASTRLTSGNEAATAKPPARLADETPRGSSSSASGLPRASSMIR